MRIALTERYSPFLLAVFAHLILAGFLLNSVVIKHHPIVKALPINNIIQSYLFIKPKVIKPNAVKPQNKTQHKVKPTEATVQHKAAKNKEVQKNQLQKKQSTTKTNKSPDQSSNINDQEITRKLDSLQQKTTSKYSFSTTVLDQFKNQLNNKIMTEQLNYAQRPRGLSIFNDLPPAVTHSVKKLTLLEKIDKKQKMATHYAGGSTIIKNDDGTCTLIEDLTSRGMEGITAISKFGCGQTKMDKWYDAHMDKVLKKLGKKK